MIQTMKLITFTLNIMTNQFNIGPCHVCNGPHLIKNCNNSICGRCKSNLDKHTPSQCHRKCPFNKQQSPNPFHSNDNSNRTKINNHTEPNAQLSISTNKLDHMAELLEATRKMTKYFKRLYKHNKLHSTDNSNCQTSTNHYNNSHSGRHKHKPCNNNGEVNKITNSTHTSKTHLQNLKIAKNAEHQTALIAYSIPLWTWNDYQGKMELLKLN